MDATGPIAAAGGGANDDGGGALPDEGRRRVSKSVHGRAPAAGALQCAAARQFAGQFSLRVWCAAVCVAFVPLLYYAIALVVLIAGGRTATGSAAPVQLTVFETPQAASDGGGSDEGAGSALSTGYTRVGVRFSDWCGDTWRVSTSASVVSALPTSLYMSGSYGVVVDPSSEGSAPGSASLQAALAAAADRRSDGRAPGVTTYDAHRAGEVAAVDAWIAPLTTGEAVDLSFNLTLGYHEARLAALVQVLMQPQPQLGDDVATALGRATRATAGGEAGPTAWVRQPRASEYPLRYGAAFGADGVGAGLLWPFTVSLSGDTALQVSCVETAPAQDTPGACGAKGGDDAAGYELAGCDDLSVFASVRDDNAEPVFEEELADDADETVTFVTVTTENLVHASAPSFSVSAAGTLSIKATQRPGAAGGSGSDGSESGSRSGSGEWHGDQAENDEDGKPAPPLYVDFVAPPLYVDVGFVPCTACGEAAQGAGVEPVPVVTVSARGTTGDAARALHPQLASRTARNHVELPYTGAITMGANTEQAGGATTLMSAMYSGVNVSAAAAREAGWGNATAQGTPAAAVVHLPETPAQRLARTAGALVLSATDPASTWAAGSCAGCDHPPAETCKMQRLLSRLTVVVPVNRSSARPSRAPPAAADQDAATPGAAPDNRASGGSGGKRKLSQRVLRSGSVAGAAVALLAGLGDAVVDAAAAVAPAVLETALRSSRLRTDDTHDQPTELRGEAPRRLQSSGGDDGGSGLLPTDVRVESATWVPLASDDSGPVRATLAVVARLTDQSYQLVGPWPTLGLELETSRGPALRLVVRASVARTLDAEQVAQLNVTMEVASAAAAEGLVAALIDGDAVPVGVRFHVPGADDASDPVTPAPALYRVLAPFATWVVFGGTPFGGSVIPPIVAFLCGESSDEACHFNPSSSATSRQLTWFAKQSYTLPNFYFAGIDLDGGGNVDMDVTPYATAQARREGRLPQILAPVDVRLGIRREPGIAVLDFAPFTSVRAFPDVGPFDDLASNSNATQSLLSALAMQVPVRGAVDLRHRGFELSPPLPLPLAQSCCYDAHSSAVARMAAATLRGGVLGVTPAGETGAQFGAVSDVVRLPVCCASVASAHWNGDAGANRLLFAAPGGLSNASMDTRLDLGTFAVGDPHDLVRATLSANSYKLQQQSAHCTVERDTQAASLVSANAVGPVELRGTDSAGTCAADLAVLVSVQNHIPLRVTVTVPQGGLTLRLDTCALVRRVGVALASAGATGESTTLTKASVLRAAMMAPHEAFTSGGCGLLPVAVLPVGSDSHVLRDVNFGASEADTDVTKAPRSGSSRHARLVSGTNMTVTLEGAACVQLAAYVVDNADALAASVGADVGAGAAVVTTSMDPDTAEGTVMVLSSALQHSLVLDGRVEVRLDRTIPVNETLHAMPASGCLRLRCTEPPEPEEPSSWDGSRRQLGTSEDPAGPPRASNTRVSSRPRLQEQQQGRRRGQSSPASIDPVCARRQVTLVASTDPFDTRQANVSIALSARSWIWLLIIVALPAACVTLLCFARQEVAARGRVPFEVMLTSPAVRNGPPYTAVADESSDRSDSVSDVEMATRRRADS